VDLIPKALVVGVFTATPPGAPDREKLNRVWSELSGRQEYRQFNITADGAQFLGPSEDALLIQPPLIQVRSAARLGIQNAADEAQVAMRTVARHLGWAQFFNLGIKQIYHAPAPGNDSRRFVSENLLGGGHEAMAELERGEPVWAGLKYGARSVDGSIYVAVIEPLLADNQFLFVDLDVQLPGPTDLDKVTDRVAEASDYASRVIRQFLEGHSSP
jgi:hypothetical protein